MNSCVMDVGFPHCWPHCMCVPRNPFESAPTARFNNPKVLSLLQTNHTVCVCVRDAQIFQIMLKLQGSTTISYHYATEP